jgi:hypothetical protein
MNQYPGHNPYAPPQAPVGNQAYGPGPTGPSVYVQGKLLVAANGSALPAMCLKCGGHPTHWRAQNFRYTPPWARLIGWLGYLVFSKKSSFQIPLCEGHRAAWKKWNLIAGLSSIPGILLLVVGGAVMGADSDTGSVIFMIGMAVLLVALIGSLIIRGRRVVMPTKIDKTHSWLSGVHPTVLQFVASPPPPPGYPMQEPYGQGQPRYPYPGRPY